MCLDESGFNTNFTRSHARSPKGQRAVGEVPRNTGKNFTLICALSMMGTQAELVIEGAVNREIFECYVEKVLCPTLQVGQVVILDNLSSHKGKRGTELIEQAGGQVLFLPPYSPDFNLIEMLFSKVKGYLRKVGERCREQLLSRLGEALSRVTRSDIQGWFQHALSFL